MEYIEFGDLEECIGNSRWNEKDIKETTRQILEGLQIMHHEGIAHRDLKPQVILLLFYHIVHKRLTYRGPEHSCRLEATRHQSQDHRLRSRKATF